MHPILNSKQPSTTKEIAYIQKSCHRVTTTTQKPQGIKALQIPKKNLDTAHERLPCHLHRLAGWVDRDLPGLLSLLDEIPPIIHGPTSAQASLEFTRCVVSGSSEVSWGRWTLVAMVAVVLELEGINGVWDKCGSRI